MDLVFILTNSLLLIVGFVMGHILTKKEYEYDYRKNTEKQFETLDGLKKWQQLEDKKAKKNANNVSAV